MASLLESGLVTPFAGVWIEIDFVGSLGMIIGVTPFAGVWIEILCLCQTGTLLYVTPFAGVWIEMCNSNP